MSENLKSIIYISKRCPHCRRLLLLLQSKDELKGTIQISSIDDEPFPKMIKSVPSMISNGELWSSDELFAALEKGGNPQQQQQDQQQQPQQQQGGGDDDMLGYTESNLALGFAPLDDNPMGGDNSQYAPIDERENSLDVKNDGYIQTNKKTQQFDNDYERMMEERGKMMAQNQRN